MTGCATLRQRAGFTLIETIVTVGLIAVLAAFVIPTVIQKASAGDPVKVANDLAAIRTAMEGFAGDTKSGFPRRISMLTARPLTTDHFIDATTLLSQAQVDVWQGPYIAAVIGSADADSLATGFTAFLRNRLVRFDISNSAPEAGTALRPTLAFSAANPLFAAVRINGLTAAQAATINRLIDGSSDPDEPTTGATTTEGSNITGRFRYTAPVGGVVEAYFMSAPIF